MIKDKRSKGILVGEENKIKIGSGLFREFLWEFWEICLDIKRKRKEKGIFEFFGSYLRCCEIVFLVGVILMEVWLGIGMFRWEIGG